MEIWEKCLKFKVSPGYRVKLQTQSKHRRGSLVICPNTDDFEGHSVISHGEPEGMVTTRAEKRWGDAGQAQHFSGMKGGSSEYHCVLRQHNQ